MTRSFFGKGQQGPNATGGALLYRAMMANASQAQDPGNAKVSGQGTKIDPVAEALGIASAPVMLPEVAPTPTDRPAPTVSSTTRSYNPNLPSRLDFLRPSAFKRVRKAGPGWAEILTEDGQIIRREGAHNWRDNNPGNIKYGHFARANGAVGHDDVFAVFPTLEAGRAAQERLLFEDPKYAGLTLAKGIETWAPEAENDTEKYIRTVAARSGISRNTLLSTLTPKERSTVLDEKRRYEGFQEGLQHLLGTFDPLDPPIDLPETAPIPTPADRSSLAAPQGAQPARVRFGEDPGEPPDPISQLIRRLLQNPELSETERANTAREIRRLQNNSHIERR